MTKRIGAIISLVVVGILIVTTLIMANVSVNYSVRCASPDAVWINTSRSVSDRITTNAQAEKIKEYISNASKTNALSALFDGELNKKAEIVSQEGEIENLTETYLVVYEYNTAQTMKYGKKTFKDGSKATHTFTKLTFGINNNSDNEYKVYVTADDDEAGEYSYYYKLTADFADLYAYLTKNF